jgi:hypothetical protein
VQKAALIMPQYTMSISEALACAPPTPLLLANIVLSGLATCHAFNLVGYSNGDIKSKNMMMTQTGIVLCIDIETCAPYGDEINGYTASVSNTLDTFTANPLLDMHLLAGTVLRIIKPRVLEAEDRKAVVEALQELKYKGLGTKIALVLLQSSSVDMAWEGVWELVKGISGVLQKELIWPLVRS